MTKALIEDLSNLFSQILQPVHRRLDHRPSWRWHLGHYLIVHHAMLPEARRSIFAWIKSNYRIDWSEMVLAESIRLVRVFPCPESLVDLLSWTHYRLLMRIKDEQERLFYLRACASQAWTVRQLARQISTNYYHRQLRADGLGIKTHYIFDFITLPIPSEAFLERQMISHMAELLLELGTNFSFVGSQRMLKLPSGQRFYIDLVFYHRSQRYYLLVELKISPLSHRDIGQLDTYIRLFDAHYRGKGNLPSVGLLLCPSYDLALLPYTALVDNDRLFVASWESRETILGADFQMELSLPKP